MTANKPVRTYTNLDRAFDWFNDRLFGGELPPCLITLQRNKGSYGYFCGERFRSLDGQETTDEIALNPVHFASSDRGVTATLSTLVHEMAHLWQHHLGTPPRRCYHNREWAAKMEEVGLIPSDTGVEGGKKTGQKVSHYVEKGGRFEAECEEFLHENPTTLYADRAGEDNEGKERRKKAASKTKYTCPGCGFNAWAKPEANLMCGECQEAMEAEEKED